MTDDVYLIAITALLPLTALMLVLQVNPYQALVMRGILGAIAALVYALFGAADVALTEALVGTMLSITLYAVAVRSSMEMRLGWVQSSAVEFQPVELESASVAEVASGAAAKTSAESAPLDPVLVTALREALKAEHLRLEILAYPSPEALSIALQNKHIHSAVWPQGDLPKSGEQQGSDRPTGLYQLQTRVKRLQEILAHRLPPSLAVVDYLDITQPQASTTSPQTPAMPLSPSAQESS